MTLIKVKVCKNQQYMKTQTTCPRWYYLLKKHHEHDYPKSSPQTHQTLLLSYLYQCKTSVSNTRVLFMNLAKKSLTLLEMLHFPRLRLYTPLFHMGNRNLSLIKVKTIGGLLLGGKTNVSTSSNYFSIT